MSRPRPLSLLLAAATALIALAASPGPATAEPGAQPRAGVVTPYGYRGSAAGLVLQTGGVENLSVRDASAQLPCTRSAGLESSKTSALSVPGNPLVTLSTSTSTTSSYRQDRRYGVRSVNVMGDVLLGGTVDGQATPQVVLKGLTTTADAFHRPAGYGHRESLTYDEFTITLPAGTTVPPELQGLLDAIDQGTGQVIQVLQDANAPIAIPGLGTVALGRSQGRADAHSASSQAYGLRFAITAGPEPATLLLGLSRATTSGPTPGGVFRTNAVPLTAHVIGDTPRWGSTNNAMTCAGTQGHTRTRHIERQSVLAGALAEITGVDLTQRGEQRANGSARALQSSHIDVARIPAARLVLRNIDTSVVTSSPSPSARKRVAMTVSLGALVYDGRRLQVPAPGERTTLPDGEGYVEVRKTSRTWYGAEVVAVRVTLLQDSLVVDLGRVQNRVYPR